MIQIAKASGKAPSYTLSIQDTIIDFNEKPHRVVKIVISGHNFPVRNSPIFVRIRNGRSLVNSWLVELSANADKVIAHFPVDITQSGNVEFGYGEEVFGIFEKPEWASFKMLDVKMIDKEVVMINKKWLEKAMAEPRNLKK